MNQTANTPGQFFWVSICNLGFKLFSIMSEKKSKGLLFNMGSLWKSPPGMDGTTYFQAEPTVRVNYLPDYPF